MSDTVPSVNNLVGPLFLASNLNWFFLGTLIIQVYNYVHAYPKDRKAIKAVVYLVLILDCAQTPLTTSTVWDYLVTHWADTPFLYRSRPTGVAVSLFGSLIGMIVQFFFAWRIWSLKRRSKVYLAVACFIVLVAFIQCVSAWVSAFKFLLLRDLAELPQILAGFTLWLSASLACDVFIAVAMVTILIDARRRSSFKPTETMINRLVAHTIQTGAVTAVVAAVEIALFVRFPTDQKHGVPAFVLGKLYSNCLLATLNARQGTYLSALNETGNGSDMITLGGTGSFGSSGTTRGGATGVTIATVQGVTVDDGRTGSQLEMKAFPPYMNA